MNFLGVLYVGVTPQGQAHYWEEGPYEVIAKSWALIPAVPCPGVLPCTLSQPNWVVAFEGRFFYFSFLFFFPFSF
jgi:hypothetical protein